ncbi:DNA-binding protein inhibitor ID-3 [Manis javanica]|nr:DNA-binding protein inhibitor ID-3 [Manis javanica]
MRPRKEGNSSEATYQVIGMTKRIQIANPSASFCILSHSLWAFQPALSPVRGCYEAVCCLSERSLAIARGRSKGPAAEEPLSLLDDMNHCYSRLRELTARIFPSRQLSSLRNLCSPTTRGASATDLAALAPPERRKVTFCNHVMYIKLFIKVNISHNKRFLNTCE